MTDENLEPKQDDSQWVELAKIGDTAAFNKLVNLYHSRIYTLTYQMTSNREDAEDLTQEIFVKAFEALPRFKGRSSFYTWLYRIGINKTINYRKKRNRNRPLSLDAMEQEVKQDESYHDLISKELIFSNFLFHFIIYLFGFIF